MSITAKEIAKLAGVSRGTVDRALKDRPGINVETKKRILDIAVKYDYKPNIIGKALVYSGKTVEVQVVLNSIGNPFFDDVKAGISSAAEEFSNYGFKISLSEFKGYDSDELYEILEDLPSDTKHLILTPIRSERVERKIQELIDSGVKVILLSNTIDNVHGATYVGCDYLKSGEVAGRLLGLLSAGRANLFIVTGTLDHKGHAQRVEGIKEVIRNEYPGIRLLGVSENGDDDDTSYYNMKSILKEYTKLDFVFITAGGVTGTLRALREHKRDVRVCTFDDTSVVKDALLTGNVMATICQQPFEQGYQSVKAIFDTVIKKQTVDENIYSELFIKVDKSL